MKTFGKFLKENNQKELVERRAAIAGGLATVLGAGIMSSSPKPPAEIPTTKTAAATVAAPEKKKDCYGPLCDAIAQAETGSFKNKFIRTTHAPTGGSTAYGPMQITGQTLKDMYARHPKNFPDTKYTESLISQSKQFAKYGKESKKKGYHKRYDYGGSGDTTSHDTAKYRTVGKGVLKGMAKDIFGKVPTDLTSAQREKLVTRWRGKSRTDDPRYFKEVDKAYTH